MKNKEEIIKKAWIDLRTKIPFGVCEISGYFHGYFCNGTEDIIEAFGVDIEKIDYDIDSDGVGKFRPKSLQGIETNNNWTKIESESDLPKDKTTQYSVCKDKKVFQSTVNCGTVINWYNIGKISHYQPIKKPEPPLH